MLLGRFLRDVVGGDSADAKHQKRAEERKGAYLERYEADNDPCGEERKSLDEPDDTPYYTYWNQWICTRLRKDRGRTELTLRRATSADLSEGRSVGAVHLPRDRIIWRS